MDNNILYDINFDHYTPHEFHSKVCIRNAISKKPFSIIHCNIRSLSANFDSLSTLLSDLQHNFSVIGISETRLLVGREQITNTSIPGYTFFSQPSVQEAGGVGLYIRDDLEFHLRDDLCISTGDYECIWIEIHRKSRNIVCAVIYRHPNGNLDNFTDYFYEVIDKISNESKLCTLLGDFNLNLLNFESHNATGDFVNTLASYYFQPHIIKPTRITDHSATLIDNIFFNSLEHEVISGNLLCDLSDHLPYFVIINDLSYSAYQGAIYKRDYSRLNEESLVAEVQSINWDAVFANDQNINSIFESFHKKITEVIDNHVPLRKLSKKECKLQAKPWITKGIRVSIAKKNKIYKEYLKYKTDYHLSIF